MALGKQQYQRPVRRIRFGRTQKSCTDYRIWVVCEFFIFLSPFPERVNAGHHYHYPHHLTDRRQNEKTIDATYTNNAESMLGYIYHAAFWTATKVA